MEGAFFYFFATLAVLSALLTITRKDAVTSAFWLIFCFLSVAALFAMLSAHFMAVLQVLLYAGAIMVFFLFVTMFLGQERARVERSGRAAMAIGLATLLGAAWGMSRVVRGEASDFPEVSETFGGIEWVSETLLTKYLLAFELTGLLLTAAVIGAVYLARREAPGARGTRSISPRENTNGGRRETEAAENEPVGAEHA